MSSLLLTTACNAPGSKKDRAPSDSPGDYFPAIAGSTWDYAGKGNEYAAFTREVLFTEDNLVQLSDSNGGTVTSSIFKITDNEITRLLSQGESYDKVNLLHQQPTENTIILKGPLAVGTKWQAGNTTREIVEVHAEVSTPAGVFQDCIAVKNAGENSDVFEYYQKNVGLVKREFVSGDTRVTSSLQAYDLKK